LRPLSNTACMQAVLTPLCLCLIPRLTMAANKHHYVLWNPRRQSNRIFNCWFLHTITLITILLMITAHLNHICMKVNRVESHFTTSQFDICYCTRGRQSWYLLAQRSIFRVTLTSRKME
jgi:hypothetical protein